MDVEKLRQLGQADLNDYLWRRLRLEPPTDPRLSDRFGQEAPEEFVMGAVQEAGDAGFRRRVLNAVRENLKRLAIQRASTIDSFQDDDVADQQVASLAFLASGLEAFELVHELYLFLVPYSFDTNGTPARVSDGQFHLLRALAELQSDHGLSDFWAALWRNGPRAIRGLTIFGWARANEEAALSKLGELVAMEDQIDLPTTLWSLVDADGPGTIAVGRAASRLSSSQQKFVRQALVDAGADDVMLRDFDLQVQPPGSTVGAELGESRESLVRHGRAFFGSDFSEQDDNGVDLSLIRENLRRTPAERLRRADKGRRDALRLLAHGRRNREKCP